ncbi:hypothetical protein [Paenibacillus campi]|uniref:hypothetical protein n=1 Tax=Paenibacillus campi TaxID=3106031 RepID=UPI002AFEAF51|nr:hypothetical protein [Paenibacillus sp. SGZ-1009]
MSQMTSEDIKKQVEGMKKFREDMMREGDKKKALDFLVRAGTHDKNGKLTKEYR